MNKEEVDRTISLLIHQNLCVVNNGNKEYPDFVVGGTDLLKKELSKLFSLSIVSKQRELLAISCLNNIIQPIDYLKQLAELDGGKLDGSFAVHLTKQGMFYQELAKKAIKEIDNCG